MYKEIEDDLITLHIEKAFDYIAHQCNLITRSKNCQGIARGIFSTFKEAAAINNAIIEIEYNWMLLGDCSEAEGIINIYAQYRPGKPTNNIDSLECRMSYLKEAFTMINESYKGKSIGFPLIASGLSRPYTVGLTDYEYFIKFIKPLMIEHLPNINITIVKLKR